MGMVFCRGCGKEIHETAPTCPHCGAPQGRGIETSKDSAIPDGIKGWSWGAFLLSWIWAIGNKTWIGLFAIIPYVGFIMAIVLGFKGREWAWKNKQWESIEHFNRVQKKWSFWGVIIIVVVFLLGVFTAVAVSAYHGYIERAKSMQQSQTQSDTNNTVDTDIENAVDAPVSTIEPAPQLEADVSSEVESVQQASFSPSFDCAKASIGAERLICSDSELAALDVDLMQAYKGLRSVYPNKQELKKEQNDWMKRERNICTTTDCMMEAYRSRIDYLETTRTYLSNPIEFR